MGKLALIYVFTALSVFFISNNNNNSMIERSNQVSIDYFCNTQATNIANALASMILSKIADSTSFRSSTPQSLSFFNGTATYRVVDTTISLTSYLKVNISGNYFNKRKNLEIICNIPSGGTAFTPATVKASITTNNPVSTLGNLTVDGRNHDLDGDLVPGTGTKGIWTTSGTLSQGGSSDIGGTHAGTDYTPSKPANANTVAKSQVYPGGYPTTPDSVLGGTANGYPPNYLKNFAISGVNGSQYTTNPSTLTYPLRGVTYVELPAGGQWNPANIDGAGLLIIHNNSLNASIKNINSGTFKGMVIADDVDKIHTTIIGALIVISPAPPSGNTIGNGSGSVLYSSEAIGQATIKTKGSSSLYGFGKKRLNIVSWYE